MQEQAKALHRRDNAGHEQVRPVTVTLLSPFRISLDGKSAGPWPRPSAKRLCELLMLRPDHRLLREVVREMFFPNLAPEASANALRRTISMARQALSPLGEVGSRLLQADRCQIWLPTDISLDIDLVTHAAALRSALALEPGGERDAALSTALHQIGPLLNDEPYADWALEPRDSLELLRQRARLELARNRAHGHGPCQLTAVIEAWEACLAYDSASEEAADSLMRAYAVQGQRQLVARTYRRCREALSELGLNPSSALERTYQRATEDLVELAPHWSCEKFEWVTNAPTSLAKFIDLEKEEPRGRALVRP